MFTLILLRASYGAQEIDDHSVWQQASIRSDQGHIQDFLCEGEGAMKKEESSLHGCTFWKKKKLYAIKRVAGRPMCFFSICKLLLIRFLRFRDFCMIILVGLRLKIKLPNSKDTWTGKLLHSEYPLHSVVLRSKCDFIVYLMVSVMGKCC